LNLSRNGGRSRPQIGRRSGGGGGGGGGGGTRSRISINMPDFMKRNLKNPTGMISELKSMMNSQMRNHDEGGGGGGGGSSGVVIGSRTRSEIRSFLMSSSGFAEFKSRITSRTTSYVTSNISMISIIN
jgi:hypothetical protein